MAFILGSSLSKSREVRQSQMWRKTGMSGLVVLLLTLVVTCMGNAQSPSQLEETKDGNHCGGSAGGSTAAWVSY